MPPVTIQQYLDDLDAAEELQYTSADDWPAGAAVTSGMVYDDIWSLAEEWGWR